MSTHAVTHAMPIDWRLVLPPVVSLQARVRHDDDAHYHGGPRAVSTITGLILHLTDGPTWASAHGWLNRPHSDAPASYHYGIDRDGTIARMLPPDHIAYHAGLSSHPAIPCGGHNSVNACTIGIAFACGCGSDDAPSRDRLTTAQLDSGEWLCRVMGSQYRIPVGRVRGHREVSPGRKFDPLPAILDLPAWRSLLAQPALPDEA